MELYSNAQLIEKINVLERKVAFLEGQNGVVKHWDTIRRSCREALKSEGFNERDIYLMIQSVSQFIRSALSISRVDLINANNFMRAKQIADAIINSVIEREELK